MVRYGRVAGDGRRVEVSAAVSGRQLSRLTDSEHSRLVPGAVHTVTRRDSGEVGTRQI